MMENRFFVRIGSVLCGILFVATTVLIGTAVAPD